MIKTQKVLLISVYGFLLFYYLKMILFSKTTDSIELEYVFRKAGTIRKILKDIKKHGAIATLRKLSLNFRKPKRLPTDLKYILKWTTEFSSNPDLPNGQIAFISNKCGYINCFITTDKNLLPDRRYVDSILFDVGGSNWDHDRPFVRAPHQYYIFFASDSATDYPICEPFYDSHYNLTWTYKLDSDIRWSFLTIADKTGKFIGPEKNISWIEPMKPVPKNVVKKLRQKRKAVAWFVSKCRTKSRREKLATKISAALAKHDLKIDIYGLCGNRVCRKDQNKQCLDLLEKDYYFYLAFESSLSEDYVTDKVLHALRHFTVPIVYGGADYSRFLPPGSYLDAGVLNATELVSKMIEAMEKPAVYQNYFRWHNHYTYKKSAPVPNVCTLCEMLNNPTLGQRVVKNFRRWWLPNYERICKNDKLLRTSNSDAAFMHMSSLF